MTAEEARLHFGYSNWASRRLRDAALGLSKEEQLKDLGVSHKSLHETLQHIFLADRIWFSRTVDPGVLELDDPLAVAKRWEDWAERLSDQDLLRVVDYKDMKENDHRTPVWQIVLHVVNHGTLHRGQAMSLLRQLGAAPPPTDLIYYYREIMVK
jgi:uncharacterized damage-inducible protein DinB